MKVTFIAVLSLVIVGVLGINIPQAINGQTPEKDQIVIGFIPTEKAEELTPKAEDLAIFLETKFNNTVDVNVLVTNAYEPLIEGLRFGHVDAAFMDTGPAWIAHNRTGANVELAEVVDGKIYYQAAVFARSDDNSTQNLNQTIGKNVAFTSLTGSSGFIIPVGTLIERGLIDVNGNDFVAVTQALDNAFESHIASGGYKEALTLLLNGNVDIAFGADDAPQRFLTPEQQGQVRTVEEIGKVPSHVFIVSKDMPANTKEKLIDGMLELNFPENNHILMNIYGAEALLPTTTEGHIGEFGDKIAAVSGIDNLLFEDIE